MKNGAYNCCLCNKTFQIAQKFIRHLHMVHKEKEKQLHTCKVCGKNLSSFKRLKSHWNTHTGERPYACDRCNKSFTSSSDLSKHEKDAHK